MNESASTKYWIFGAILIVGVGLDQWTKWYAQQRLATSRPGEVVHQLELDVSEADQGETLREFLAEEFSWNDAETIEQIAAFHVRGPTGEPVGPDEPVEPGETLTVLNRSVTVVDGYWDFEYTVNPGAAFGLLSDSDSPYRTPFFVVVSLLALLIILYILRGVDPRQRLLIAALSFIGTGAVGNFIDRIRFGHVIDFIVWKLGDDLRWPTFNVADAFITIGVTLMLLEIIRDAWSEPESQSPNR